MVYFYMTVFIRRLEQNKPDLVNISDYELL